MKYLFIIFLFGCTATAQQKVEDKGDKEFLELMNRFNSTYKESKEVQKEAENKETELVNEAAEKIVTLNNAVNELKIELNEVKASLDSVSNDTGRAFMLLPISGNKENK